MRIGITGSYASGKGTVCSMFEKLGAVHVDTDIIARNIVVPGSEALQEIINVFGDQYLTDKNELDRAKLAERVFNDKEAIETLNSITHPKILEKVLKLTENSEKIYVVNTPLLFESGFDKYMDFNVTVKSSDELSLLRGKKRDKITEENIKSRLKNQFSLKEKLKFSDHIIDNTGTLNNTRKQVEELWKILIKMKRKTQK